MFQDDEDIYIPLPGELPKVDTSQPAWLIFNELFSVSTRYGDLTLIDDRPDEVVVQGLDYADDYITATSGVTVEYQVDHEMNEFRMDILSGRSMFNSTSQGMEQSLEDVVERLLPISVMAEIVACEGLLVFNTPSDMKRAMAILSRYVGIKGATANESIHQVDPLTEDMEILSGLLEKFKDADMRTAVVNKSKGGFLRRTYKTRRHTKIEAEPEIVEPQGKSLNELFNELGEFANPYDIGD